TKEDEDVSSLHRCRLVLLPHWTHRTPARPNGRPRDVTNRTCPACANWSSGTVSVVIGLLRWIGQDRDAVVRAAREPEKGTPPQPLRNLAMSRLAARYAHREHAQDRQRVAVQPTEDPARG